MVLFSLRLVHTASVDSDECWGIPSAVIDGESEKLFELNDAAEKYSAYIEMVLANFYIYSELCRSSFETYNKKLIWTIAVNAVNKYLEEL
jgi:hypothetical protein